MVDQLERERLLKITNSLIETITSPPMVERMRQFRASAAAGADFGGAGELMSLESLRSAGANLPEDFRLTSRVFEDRESGLRVEIRPGTGLGAVSASNQTMGACAGGGAGTVCGCAGGGS